MNKLLSPIVVLIGLLLASCGAPSPTADQAVVTIGAGLDPATVAPEPAIPTIAPTAPPEPSATPMPTRPRPSPTAAAPAGYVSRALLGDAWPLTVADGVLACRDRAVTFASGGVVYALNGTAKDRGLGADIAPIWADGAVEGLKKNIGPLIERGLLLCN
jgi:hypothetical protein